MKPFNAPLVVKRLAAAEGFLELNMPGYTLAELDRISDFGPFEAIGALFRGEALQAQDRFEEAIVPLQRAAELFPAPYSQRAWASLSRCYHAAGQEELAARAATAANDPAIANSSASTSQQVVVQVVIAPIFTIKTKLDRRESNLSAGPGFPEDDSPDEQGNDWNGPQGDLN